MTTEEILLGTVLVLALLLAALASFNYTRHDPLPRRPLPVMKVKPPEKIYSARHDEGGSTHRLFPPPVIHPRDRVERDATDSRWWKEDEVRPPQS